MTDVCGNGILRLQFDNGIKRAVCREYCRVLELKADDPKPEPQPERTPATYPLKRKYGKRIPYPTAVEDPAGWPE